MYCPINIYRLCYSIELHVFKCVIIVKTGTGLIMMSVIRSQHNDIELLCMKKFIRVEIAIYIIFCNFVLCAHIFRKIKMQHNDTMASAYLSREWLNHSHNVIPAEQTEKNIHNIVNILIMSHLYITNTNQCWSNVESPCHVYTDTQCSRDSTLDKHSVVLVVCMKQWGVHVHLIYSNVIKDDERCTHFISHGLYLNGVSLRSCHTISFQVLKRVTIFC